MCETFGIYHKRKLLTDDCSGSACEACEGVAIAGRRATAASLLVLGGVKLLKNSSSQLKNVVLSSGERFDQSIFLSDDEVRGLGILGWE